MDIGLNYNKKVSFTFIILSKVLFFGYILKYCFHSPFYSHALVRCFFRRLE